VRSLPARISEWLGLLVEAQRSVAYLRVVGDQVLADAGGDLNHYGLSGLQCRQSASAQLPFLEGLLPLPEPSFLLRSIGMPSGRVADVHFLGEDESTWVVLLDVTAEHDEAQKVQQKAYDMTLLSEREARLLARVEAAHRDLTVAHQQLTESREALLEAHRRLQEELRAAERYVRAILPKPVAQPLAIDWRFIPSVQLGGDAFGYHWIDPDHMALYLLDVCGHGVKASLMAISAMNVLRNQTLAATDFRQPSQVLASMNEAFQMERHADMYFTLWYGVYEASSRRLLFASGGHPPAILMSGGDGNGRLEELSNAGMIVGAFPRMAFDEQSRVVAEASRLYVFSDGIYEVTRPDGTMLTFGEFTDILSSASRTAASPVEETLQRIRAQRGHPEFEDDVSIIEVKF
jgi:serine phosphatase RsbU (regulator of sigma subunit)